MDFFAKIISIDNQKTTFKSNGIKMNNVACTKT